MRAEPPTGGGGPDSAIPLKNPPPHVGGCGEASRHSGPSTINSQPCGPHLCLDLACPTNISLRVKTIAFCALLAVLLASGAFSLSAQTDEVSVASSMGATPRVPAALKSQTISFDSSESGKLPTAFSTALTGGGGPISWVVRDDPTAPNCKKVLVQESSDDTSYRFPLCLYDQTVARDVAVEVNYKAISGKVDQAGGIVLRYRPENYYIARANVLEDNIDLFKTVNGKRSKIEEVSVKVTPGEWHLLRFEAKGSYLKVSFDGKVVIETDDTTFSQSGKIGLWTKADSVSAFTNLKIEPVQ